MHLIFIYFSINGNLGCFHVLSIVNSSEHWSDFVKNTLSLMRGEWLRVPLMTQARPGAEAGEGCPCPSSSPRLSRPGTREFRAARMALGP